MDGWGLGKDKKSDAIQNANVPFVSHIDNPYAPTEDLAFGIPRQVFYNAVNASGTPITYTNNNLYNKYWLNYITETTSKEALQLEVLRLRQENLRLTEQRDILKKAAGILSEPPPRDMPGYRR